MAYALRREIGLQSDICRFVWIYYSVLLNLAVRSCVLDNVQCIAVYGSIGK